MKNLLFALRYLLKPRGGNLTRLVSLVLGLSVGLLICSYVGYTLTFDRFFPDRGRIYQIWSMPSNDRPSSRMVAPLAPALAEEMPAIAAATRLCPGFRYNLFRDDEPFACEFAAVDTCFFDVLDFGVVRGDAKALTGRDRLMLSESFARTIFGDRDPLGELLMLKNQLPMTVVGIFRDVPRNNSVGYFNALVPLDCIADSYYMGWDGGDSFPSYVKLREGASIAEVEALLPAFIDRREAWKELAGDRLLFVPIARASKIGSTVVQTAWILSGLALLILFVSAMNYVLVSVSALVERARTIAMLRCHGARRGDIVRIFLSETALLGCAALAVSAFLIWALQQQVEQLTGSPVGELFAPGRIWVPACTAVATLLAAGVLPSLLFASVPLTTAFRGLAAGRRGWKRALLCVQMGVVAFSLAALAAFTLQVRHLRDGDMGFDARRVVSFMPMGTRAMFRNMAEAMQSLPEAEAAGVASSLPVWGYSGQPCYDETTHELLFDSRIAWCDEYYLGTLGFELAAGRGFTAAGAADEALVNERYCLLRGWTPEEAVGRTVSSSPDPESPWLHRIVGVVRDFRTDIGSGETEPMLIGNIDERMPPEEGRWYGGSYVCVRLREVTPEALDAVRRKIREWPSVDNHHLVLLPEQIDMQLRTETRIRRIASIVSAAVLLVALIGLAGYLDDEIRRRRREVAIRRVNGAAGGDVAWLLVRDIALLSLPAMAVGLALSGWVMHGVLELFVSRIRLDWRIFAGVAALQAAIMALVSLRSLRRAVGANPAEAVKAE